MSGRIFHVAESLLLYVFDFFDYSHIRFFLADRIREIQGQLEVSALLPMYEICKKSRDKKTAGNCIQFQVKNTTECLRLFVILCISCTLKPTYLFSIYDVQMD